jgi:hypothetical protein
MNAGGAATAGGVDFQGLVGAWVAVHLLAEAAVSVPWDIPADVVFTSLRAEVDAAVDDVQVTSSASGLIYIQAKREVSLSDRPDSPLGKAFQQFVELHVTALREGLPGTVPRRQFDAQRDRMVLATAYASEPINQHLSATLRRMRELGTPAQPHDCTTNKGERKALAKVVMLVRRLWRSATSSVPSWPQLRPLLQSIWISALSLEQDEAEERLTKHVLRDSILHDPKQADIAWTSLRMKAIELAKRRSGVDRAELQRTLIGSTIHLRSLRSYETDTAELQGYTRRSLRSLARHSRITYDGNGVRIARPQEVVLRREAEAESLLLIGDAGCGKSGLLATVVQTWLDERRDVVLLNAAELGVNSMGLLRTELSLQHDLIDVLEQWHGPAPGFVIIDALDSARDDKSARMLRQVIEGAMELRGRWRVVATIRKFDLRHGSHWQQLMPGSGIRPFFDSSFDDARHLNVEKLSIHELDSIRNEAPELHEMITAAPAAFVELVRVPFNLMLANELRTAGAAADLTTITTQLQLLDRYWQRRLDGTLSERRDRDAVLADIANAMVTTRRLQVPLAATKDAVSLDAVLTRSVLVEREGAVQFAHHVLFDYAVERLLLRPDQHRTIERLESDRDLALAIGPSLKFWFEGEWERDTERNAFWNFSLRLTASDVPSVAKIMSGTVAADRTKLAVECAPLVRALSTDVGQRLFMFLADALTADMSRVGKRVPIPWFRVIDEASRHGSIFVAHRASYLLNDLISARPSLSSEDLEHAGRAARQMLARAWKVPTRSKSFVVSALRAVIRTFDSNIAESAELLRRVLEPDHVRAYGHEELRWLADEAPVLAKVPSLAIELYEATFTAHGDPDRKTAISESRIIGFSSNAQQDIESSQWLLGQHFPALAKAQPELGVEIAVRVARAYALHHRFPGKKAPQEFRLLGHTAHVTHDSLGSPQDDEQQIVSVAMHQLARLLGASSTHQRGLELLQYLAQNNSTVLIWQSLFETATASLPLFLALKELLYQPTVLRNFSKQVAEWFQAYGHYLDAQERADFERTVLLLRDEGWEHAAFRLVRSIAAEDLSQDARTWVEAEEKLIKERLAHAPRGASPDDDDDDDDELGEYQPISGVSSGGPSSEAQVTARQMTRNLDARLLSLEKEPAGAALDQLEQDLVALRAHLETQPIHHGQVGRSWGVLAKVASTLARLGRGSVKGILLEAARRPEPLYDPDQEKEFARGPSWSSDQARIEAVDGLIAIASHAPDDSVLQAIEALADDRTAAVRYQVARVSPRVAKEHPTLFWMLIERLMSDENTGVARGLFYYPVRVALALDAQRGLSLLLRSYADAIATARSDNLEYLFNMILVQYLSTNAQEAALVANAVADAPLGSPVEAGHVMMTLRESLTYSRSETQPNGDALRQRAIAYVRRMTTATLSAFDELISQPRTDVTEQRQLQDAAKLLGEISQELYFASLAHDHERRKPDPLIRRRFYLETRDILSQLAAVGLPGVAHYLVLTLASYIDLVDPTDVFLLIGETVKAGQKGGYQYESMAVKEIVAIVQRYLADFRAIFIDHEGSRAALRDILDIFVEAGWPETHRLVYSLESMFR